MKNFALILFLFLGLSQVSMTNDTDQNHAISLDFHNIRNTDGFMYIYLYNYSNQYPYHPYKHFRIDKNKVKSGRLQYTIDSLKKGKYAITAIDDENNNKNLDRFLGIPVEGFAFSNNIKGLSLPSYKRLLFTLHEPKKHLSIKVQYL